jgi:nucleoside-diphosphate kinase
MVKPDCYT